MDASGVPLALIMVVIDWDIRLLVRKRLIMLKNHSAFTLLELIIVLLIIATTVGFGVPAFRRTMERARDHEALTNLRLIQAAERIYREENTFFFPFEVVTKTAIAEINDRLNLFLNENRWDYEIENDGAGGFIGRANRQAPTGGYGNYAITQNIMIDPACVGTCP